MGRLGIEDLGKPPKRYRPSWASQTFETKKAAAMEDQWRLKRLKKQLKRLAQLDIPLPAAELKQLVANIRPARTPASSVYMRKLRNRIGGQLWAAIEADLNAASTFTLVPRSGQIFGGRLHNVDPRVELARLRSALIRAGFDGQDGWLIVVVHGEHEPTEDVFVVHFHGLAVGSARAAIDRLREQRDFDPTEAGAKNKLVARRVRMSRQQLTDLPDSLTYIAQSFWPERPAFENRQGVSKRQRHKRRIEEPRHTEVLAWLNRWRFADTCLLMGIKVTREGLRPTGETYTNGGGS